MICYIVLRLFSSDTFFYVRLRTYCMLNTRQRTSLRVLSTPYVYTYRSRKPSTGNQPLYSSSYRLPRHKREYRPSMVKLTQPNFYVLVQLAAMSSVETEHLNKRHLNCHVYTGKY